MLQLPWIAEFVMECGWCVDVVNIFGEIDKDQVNPSVMAAHEDLLCCVLKVSFWEIIAGQGTCRKNYKSKRQGKEKASPKCHLK